MLGFKQDTRPANRQATEKAIKHLVEMLDVKTGRKASVKNEVRVRKHKIEWA